MINKKIRRVSNSPYFLYHAKRDKNYKEQHIECCKFKHILECISGLVLGIRFKRYKAGKGCDECTHAADINAEKQLAVVLGELRQQDRRGNVTDHLTGQCAENQGAFFKQT